jgi:hypothetical protein
MQACCCDEIPAPKLLTFPGINPFSQKTGLKDGPKNVTFMYV